MIEWKEKKRKKEIKVRIVVVINDDTYMHSNPRDIAKIEIQLKLNTQNFTSIP